MNSLYLGIAIFVLFHLIPVYAPDFRARMMEKIGRNPYRGIFAVISLIGLTLIITGWKDGDTTAVYMPPAWAPHLTALLVLVGFVLFFSSRAPTNIKRVVRHPQMTGLLLWSAGHLVANGDVRSVALFGSLGLWAVLAILGANRRDGEWVKPEKQPLVKDIITVLIGLSLYALFAFWAHEWLFGVRPMG